VTEAVIAVVSIIYMITAIGYGADAGRVPAIIAAIAAVISLFRLVSRAIRGLRARTSVTRQGEPAPADAALAVVTAGSAGLEAGDGGGQGSQDHPFGTNDLPELAATGHPAADPRGNQPPDTERITAPAPEPSQRRRRLAREFVALGWIWAAIAASYLFGFAIGVPLIALAYCLTSVEWKHLWQRLLYAGVVTCAAFGITYVFISLFSLTFNGLII
jgi:hypothetical protein